VEERIQEKKDDTGGDQPAKRPCTGAEKQFKKLPGGDLTTMTYNMDSTARSFRNLTLSFRGSERQAPNALQLALRFSKIMETRQAEGKHHQSMTVDERLRDVVEDFHSCAGLQSKHKLDEDRLKAVGNIISGTSVVLAVTQESQILHLKLCVANFAENGRRLRASAWPRVRWSPASFDAHCDFACVFASVLREGRLLASWTPEKEETVIKAFFQKILGDYWQEIEATVTSKLSTWKLQHLGIWADVVEPEAAPAAKVHSAAELLEIEGECQAAKFREVRAKVAQDIADMTQYNSSLKESERRAHVVTVMHERGQVQIGKELLVTSFVCRLMPFVLFNLCLLGFGIPFKATFLDVSGKRLSENFMEKVCRVSLVTDKQPCDPKVEAVYRQAAANFKALVSPSDLYTVVYMDCTKMGVLNQGEINNIGALAERFLARNPSRSVLVLIPPLLVGSDSAGTLRKDYRRLEDKLGNHKVELRSFTLNLNVDDLHKNRDLPSAYPAYIGVMDSTLPLRGTAHRVVRGGAPEPENTVNVFCGSPLWLRQALPPSSFPPALPEKDFVVPGGSSFLSHSERRSLTDLQETAQWIGGTSVPKAILEQLMCNIKGACGAVVVHTTAYDGCLEFACLQLGYPVVGTNNIEPHYKCARDIVKGHLLEVWFGQSIANSNMV
ncbi:Sodium/hydrogen exchanger 3, partial [Durusdinium trenchii]